MNFRDAKIDEKSGNPIVYGRLSLGKETFAAKHFPDHDRLLLEFIDERGFRTGITIWPVTEVRQLENGFCRPTLGSFGIYLEGFGKKEIDIFGHFDKAYSIIRGGTSCGRICERYKYNEVWKLSAYEAHQHFDAEGMKLSIAAQLIDPDLSADPTGALNGIWAGQEIIAEMTIGWGSLHLMGFATAATFWKFGHESGQRSNEDTAERARDPNNLHDLLITEHLTSPICSGTMDLGPDAGFPVSQTSTAKFISVSISPNKMGFSDAPWVHVLENGFARFDAPYCTLRIDAVGGDWLGQLTRRESLSLSLAGDGLGRADYKTSHGLEPGDPFGQVHQMIKALEVSAKLSADELEIDIRGEFDEFEPALRESFRRERGASLIPLMNFRLHTKIPSSALTLRAFSAARSRASTATFPSRGEVLI